jgi:L,D-transpeptidase YcbB
LSIVVTTVIALTMMVASYALASETTPSPATQPAYQRLSLALSRYRAMEAHGGWPALTTDLILKPGSEDDRVVLLRQRLLSEGDLPTMAVEGRKFDEMLATAVKRFQARHGLVADGRVGRKTLSELNITAHDRVAQIAANLERWSELSVQLPSRRLEINIPAAELVAFDENRPIMSMRVVVGTNQNPTPVLRSQVIAVVFNPSWTVPTSIVRNEILPRLRQDPLYLRRNGIQIIDRPADPYGEKIGWTSPDRPRTLALRQQPGPKNALGRIKFDIPNVYSVYLHDTANKNAFSEQSRAMSHGCIRVQHPEDLARYILRDQLRADPELVARALTETKTVEVKVTESVPVLIVYQTAFVTADGVVNFRPDVYSRDVRQRVSHNQPNYPKYRGSLVASTTGCGHAQGPG